MSYTGNLRILLPDSILNIKPGSNNAKLWGLFSTQMDAIDQLLEDMRLLRDFMSQSGVILDLIGGIVREKRNGKDDASYRIYLAVAIMKMLSDGSIDILNDIARSILGDDYIGMRELYPSQQDQPWATDPEYQFWLDGTWWLDGRYMLSGKVFQPAFFELRINTATAESLKSYIKNILDHTKGGGIAYRIKEV
jgi:hypothetical protein